MNFSGEALLCKIHKEWLDECELDPSDAKPQVKKYMPEHGHVETYGTKLVKLIVNGNAMDILENEHL